MIRPEYQAELDRIEARLMELLEWNRDKRAAMDAWYVWRDELVGTLKELVALLEGVE